MIEHEGIVEKISENHITIRILQQSACSACHAKGACMAADSKEKLIEVKDTSAHYCLNERVIIQGKESIGYRAILWAFVLPLIILISAITLSVSIWKMGEIQAALAGIAALVPYYLILFLLRHKMANSFQFTIKKTN